MIWLGLRVTLLLFERCRPDGLCNWICYRTIAIYCAPWCLVSIYSTAIHRLFRFVRSTPDFSSISSNNRVFNSIIPQRTHCVANSKISVSSVQQRRQVGLGNRASSSRIACGKCVSNTVEFVSINYLRFCRIKVISNLLFVSEPATSILIRDPIVTRNRSRGEAERTMASVLWSIFFVRLRTKCRWAPDEHRFRVQS